MEGFLEEVTSELSLEGKRNHYAKAHLYNSMVCMCVNECVEPQLVLYGQSVKDRVEGDKAIMQDLVWAR